MSCLADRMAAHRELARQIETRPCVRAVDTIPPAETPTGKPETEILVEATDNGTVPNAALLLVVQSSLGLVDCQRWQHDALRRLVVR
jgi:hypothetical protein